MSDLTLFAHPTSGVLGIMGAVWVLVEALNASEANQARLVTAAVVVAVCFSAAWILGGYWYVNYYYVEKAAILKGRGHLPTTCSSRPRSTCSSSPAFWHSICPSWPRGAWQTTWRRGAW
jgi:hypothetical protein